MAEILIRLRPTGRSVFNNIRRLAAMRSASRYEHTAEAVASLTREAQRVMLKAVQGKPVSWSGGTMVINRISGKLAGSILGGYRYPFRGNALSGAIEVKMRHYQAIKWGVKPYDMKPKLLASPKARISAKGIRYLVVPIPVDPLNPWGARVFRIVTERSMGWIHPGTAPRRLDLYTAEKMRPKAARRLREALKADMGV